MVIIAFAAFYYRLTGYLYACVFKLVAEFEVDFGVED